MHSACCAQAKQVASQRALASAACLVFALGQQRSWSLGLQDLLSSRDRIPPAWKEPVLTQGLEGRGDREDSLLVSLWISRKHLSLGCTNPPIAINVEPTILIQNYCPV